MRLPNRAKTPCSKPGCRALISVGSGGLCEDCRKAKHKEYNKHQRDQNSQAFYNSGFWRRLRNRKLRMNPLCEHCQANNDVVLAQMVDHIVERKDGGADSIENLQSLCNACHEKKTDRFKRNKQDL